MPYVDGGGRVLKTKPFGVALIMDYFWGTVNFVTLFFRGLFHMDDERTQRGQYGPTQRVPGRRGMGGIRHSGGAASAPPACMPGGG